MDCFFTFSSFYNYMYNVHVCAHVMLCRSCSTTGRDISLLLLSMTCTCSIRYVRTYLTLAEKVMDGKLRFLVPAQMYIYIDQVKLCHASAMNVSLVFYNPV